MRVRVNEMSPSCREASKLSIIATEHKEEILSLNMIAWESFHTWHEVSRRT